MVPTWKPWIPNNLDIIYCLLQAPYLWRHPFEHNIQAQIVSELNPDGTITKSDIKLVGTFAQEDILSNATSVAHLITWNFTDNTPVVYWCGKGSSTTTGPDAYLLQLSSLHQHHYHHKLETHFIPGSRNIMSDDFSHKFNLTYNELLTYFNIQYTQPVSWQIIHLNPKMNSAMTLVLLLRQSLPESYFLRSKFTDCLEHLVYVFQ